MREVLGKRVYTTLAEIVDPAHTALVVVDVQNDFCAPDGYFAQRGCDLTIMERMVPSIGRVLEAARTIGMPVVFTQTTHEPDFANIGPAWMRYAFLRYGDPPGVPPVLRGSYGHRVVDALQPIAGETVVEKPRHSAFVGTSLDLVLRCRGVESLVLTGCMTQACVETTARDAVCFDYYTVVLSDAVGTYGEEMQRASLAMLENRVDVAGSDEVLAIWAGAARPAETAALAAS